MSNWIGSAHITLNEDNTFTFELFELGSGDEDEPPELPAEFTGTPEECVSLLVDYYAQHDSG